MLHFHIEFSANLERIVDIGHLCEMSRAEAATIAAFPLPGIRVRAPRVNHDADLSLTTGTIRDHLEDTA